MNLFRILKIKTPLDGKTQKKILLYLDKYYDDPHVPCASPGEIPFHYLTKKIDKLLDEKAPSFSDYLCKVMKAKGIVKNTDVYKPVFMSRKVFSTILSGQRPSRDSAIVLAFGLRLNISETIQLLNAAGFTLSRSSERDIIICYCIENEISPTEVDRILYHYNEEILFNR